MMKTILLLSALFVSAAVIAQDAAPAFNDGDGYRDCLIDGKAVWRHINKYDAANVHDTYKTFHHVFADNGEDFITKGPGDQWW